MSSIRWLNISLEISQSRNAETNKSTGQLCGTGWWQLYVYPGRTFFRKSPGRSCNLPTSRARICHKVITKQWFRFWNILSEHSDWSLPVNWCEINRIACNTHWHMTLDLNTNRRHLWRILLLEHLDRTLRWSLPVIQFKISQFACNIHWRVSWTRSIFVYKNCCLYIAA